MVQSRTTHHVYTTVNVTPSATEDRVRMVGGTPELVQSCGDYKLYIGNASDLQCRKPKYIRRAS